MEIDKLYQIYDVLTEAKEKIEEHSSEYLQILDAVKGSSKEKMLAAQFIGKFFKHFPEHQELAIDRQLDLCEDADALIRRHAIKELPQFCKDNKENISRISDSLAQLLVVAEGAELVQVYTSLEALVKLDAKLTCTGLISQIVAGDEVTRERGLKYLSTRFLAFGKELITKEVEEYLIVEVKKVLLDVTADEFHLCMTILGATKLGKTITGHNEMVQIAQEQAELNAVVSTVTYDDEIVERFIQCATHALPYLSKVIEATPFINFMCEKLMPLDIWSMIGRTETDPDNIQLRLLKAFAELCQFVGKIEEPARQIERIYDVSVLFMPLPSLDDEDLASAATENPSFKFSHVECLLFALHTLAKQSLEFLTFPDDAQRLKDFRSRLQYLARGTQGYIKKLQEAVKGKTEAELKEDENQIKVTALRITSNINVLIRDLFHVTPTYKAVVRLSWLSEKDTKAQAKGPVANNNNNTANKVQPSNANKRHAPITFDAGNGGTGAAVGNTVAKKNGNNFNRNGNGNNHNKNGGAKKARLSNEGGNNNQKMYAPPSGKYSNKAGNYAGNARGGSNNGNNGGGQQQGGGGGGGQKRGGGGGGQKRFNKRRY